MRPRGPARAVLARAIAPRRSFGVFAAVVLFYVTLRTYQFHVADSDESIYLYMALPRPSAASSVPDYFFVPPAAAPWRSVVALKLGASSTARPP